MLVFDANIAQQFWRVVYPADRAPAQIAALASMPASPSFPVACSLKEVLSLAPSWLDSAFQEACGNQIDVIVFNRRHQRSTKKHATHVWSGPIPEGSFYDLGGEILVPSPECTFLRMAGKLPLAKLIAYGNELCGTYAFDCLNSKGIRQRCEPLTTPERLKAYLNSAHGCAHAKAATRAAFHLIANAASPMEVFDEMLLCLPYRLGGYGLRRPHMNYRIALDERAATIASRKTCYGDLCWPDLKFDLEHHGSRYHDGDESFDSDRARVNGLKAMGYEVMELTAEQVHDHRVFEEVAIHISRLQGKRIHKAGLGLTPQRKELRRNLYAWNASFGRLTPQFPRE